MKTYRTMEKIHTICIIGGGNMGGAIAEGIAKSPNFSPGNITVTAKTNATLDRVRAAVPGIRTSLDNAEAAAGADLVILAVKPWQTKDVIDGIRPVLDYDRCTVASVVAGISFRELEEMFRKDVPDASGTVSPGLLRIIPNTAAALGKSTTFISSYNAPQDVCRETAEMFRCLGEVVEVPEEMMSAGTALASCGIAYALEYIDASIRGGVGIGFSEDMARKIVINTMKGAVALLDAHGTMPRQEIDKVATPGGYTSRGLAAMEENGFSEAVMKGLEKSFQP